MVQSHLEYAKKFIDSMEYQVKVCNGKFLAAYASLASSEIRDASHEKEIDGLTARSMKHQIDELIDSFDKNCMCRERLAKKK